METETYRIVRFYRKAGKPSETVKRGMTLDEARRHCADSRTRKNDYFDGYTKEHSI